MNKGSKAPAPPDYEAAAIAQGRANLEAIRTGAALNRVNQVTPYGTVTYRQVGTPQASQQPVQQGTQMPENWQRFVDAAPSGSIFGALADQIRAQYPQPTAGAPASGIPASDQWEQITTLSPDQQAILDAQEGNQIDMGRIANMRLNQFGNMDPLSFAGLPERVSGVTPSNFRTDVRSPGVATSNLDFSGAPQRADAQYQRSVDLSSLPEIPGINDFGAERQRVEDAFYGRATSTLDPQFKQREEAMRTRLLNSGNVEGSEAWKNEMGNFERERQGAYDQARTSSILAGGSEQSRLLADALRARGQTANELFGQGEFANAAAGATNQYGLAAREQATGETTQAGQFSNQAALQQLQGELQRLGLYNAAESDRFSQGHQNAALASAVRDAGINEQVMLRDRPLQEFMQLFGGSNGSGFNAPAVPQAGTPEAPDLMGAKQAGYQGKIDQWNSNQAQNAQTQNSLLQAAAMFAMMSDRRAKRDIERIGTLPNGLATYRFKYFNDDIPHVGVMSDEVRERFPHAVIRGLDGFDRVDYAAIDATHLLELH